MPHRRSRTGRHEKVIDSTRWAGASHLSLAQNAGAVAQTMITDGLTETILRIRGEIVSLMDGNQASGPLARMGIGALVVQAGSGTTVIQKPLTDPDAPWLFYETWVIGYEEMVVDVIDVPGLSSFRKTIDNKGQRILREGREVQLVFENLTLNAAATIQTSFVFRALLGSH